MITVGITGVGGGVGQSILRALHYSQLEVRTVAFDLDPMSAGLYWANSAYLLPPVDDEASYVARLLDYCTQEAIDVLIPGLDFELGAFARHQATFAEAGVSMIISSPFIASLVRDKLKLYHYCQSRGLAFVETHALADAQTSADDLVYPVIVKPAGGSGSNQAHLVFKPDDLRQVPVDGGYIVQTYLPAPGEDVTQRRQYNHDKQLNQTDEISAQYFVGPSGAVLGHFISVNQLKYGVPIKVDPDTESPAYNEGRRLAEALAADGLRGPVNVQGRLTPDGICFFEVNARYTGITMVRAAMGYREVDAGVLACLTGRDDLARTCLTFSPEMAGIRYMEQTIVPRARLETVEADAPATTPQAEHPAQQGHVLVTGANGYIGANVIAALLMAPDVTTVSAAVRSEEAGQRLVEALDAGDQLRIVTGSLPDEVWPLDGVEVVVHCAALRPPAAGASDDLFVVNCEGTRQLVSAAQMAGVRRLVYLSTQAVYGTTRPAPWPEGLMPQPEGPYALSKWIGEQTCQFATLNGAARDFQVISLRLARVWGLGHFMRWNELPHQFAARAATGGILTVHNGGQQRVDLLHIRDATSAAHRAVTLPSGLPSYLVFNIGGGKTISIMELATSCQTAAVREGLSVPPIEQIATDAAPRHFGMDIRRATSYLGWTPHVATVDALCELIDTHMPSATKHGI